MIIKTINGRPSLSANVADGELIYYNDNYYLATSEKTSSQRLYINIATGVLININHGEPVYICDAEVVVKSVGVQ